MLLFPADLIKIELDNPLSEDDWKLIRIRWTPKLKILELDLSRSPTYNPFKTPGFLMTLKPIP